MHLANRRSIEQGKAEWTWHFGINKPGKEIPTWSNKFKLNSCYTYWENMLRIVSTDFQRNS
ncbi:MAG: hypothetical protein KGD64_03095 [Candidatus Heimdallarchaeota archaeon]|nr:hypothetical protein [Candidatus Heimdallarchaeota archaeon]